MPVHRPLMGRGLTRLVVVRRLASPGAGALIELTNQVLTYATGHSGADVLLMVYSVPKLLLSVVQCCYDQQYPGTKLSTLRSRGLPALYRHQFGLNVRLTAIIMPASTA